MDFNTEYLRAASGEEITSCYISSQVDALTWLNNYTGASLVAQMVKKTACNSVEQLYEQKCTRHWRMQYIGCLARLHRVADSAQTPKCLAQGSLHGSVRLSSFPAPKTLCFGSPQQEGCNPHSLCKSLY